VFLAQMVALQQLQKFTHCPAAHRSSDRSQAQCCRER
jgi:hypothetical protein